MVKRKTKEETLYEVVKMSELSEGKQEITKVIIMDKHIRRKIKLGEELKLDEIAREEGVLDSIEVPDGILEVPESVLEVDKRMWGDKPTLSGLDLSKAISRDFGSACGGGRVFVSKNSYFLYSDLEIEKVLSEDLTDLQMWINTYFHSPDFSLVLAGVMHDKLKGVPFGVLWVRLAMGTYHAVNCYYSLNQKKMKVVEPQNDAVYDFNKASWCPILVVI